MGQCWIRMSWLEKFAKINYLWGGGTSIWHQGVTFGKSRKSRFWWNFWIFSKKYIFLKIELCQFLTLMTPKLQIKLPENPMSFFENFWYS